ncbi:alpha-ketoacid dehydrogenase subunit beta [Nocardiopsis alba]|uniref:Alpha-ketoacid dehydrogenase subunit beta n=2 Tax=Nocardiopsis alba TaxID=53437 RepID=A0A7K2IRV5_9ACTN|nr:alpha-ketoacid dehydrogenase subunit beta [Nocardiopsis alba]AFR07122.1 transketolase, pyrimidine binding domain protein [Nocardiopsis alba ATCC BAA-2165]MYR32671.1 alpha-ketoacid dehydrogenase subunit beta [Nocardiopsis alba]
MGTNLTIGKAINAGLRAAMEHDPKVLVMGEDVGRLGGVFRVTDGLHKDFGADRVIDTPLAESGIVGTAIGMALRGYRPVVEIQFDGFFFPAANQTFTQLAKMRRRSAGKLSMPLVMRIPYGGGIGAVEHHSESPEAYFQHTAGLRVVSVANPEDAYWMIQQAIRSDDPVIFLEPKRRYYEKAEVDTEASLQEVTPLNSARIARSGTDCTLLAYGPMVKTALQAAEADTDHSIEVIDVRSLSPVDYDTINASVKRTGRLVIAHEATLTGGPGAEIAARVTEECFYHLESPVIRVAAFDTPYPQSRLEEYYLPDLDRVLDGVDRAFAY